MLKEKKCLFVCGPTAVGKTNFAIQLAQKLNTEIFSFDSRQFYTELNIGVAKPSETELKLVKHHFIGHISIHDPYNAGMFARDALNQIDIFFQSNPQIDNLVFCGGSGLYLDALLNGLNNFEEHDPELRAHLKESYDHHGLEFIQAKLKSLDPEYFEIVDQKNPIRILRALEICIQMKAKYSDLLKQEKGYEFPYSFSKINLELPREVLYERINRRVDHMIDSDLEQEVKELLPHKDLKALQTVGYKEWFEYFENKCSKVECIDKIKQHTRNYAKRQITWFKKDTSSIILSPDDVEKAVQLKA